MFKNIIFYGFGLVGVIYSSIVTAFSLKLPKSYTDITIIIALLSMGFFIFYLYKVFQALKEDLNSSPNQYLAPTMALKGFVILLFANIFSCSGIGILTQ